MREYRSEQSQKDILYGQLEDIMSNWFLNEPKDIIIDAQEYGTLKYTDTDGNNDDSQHENSESSNISSPTTAKIVIETLQEDSRVIKNLNIHKSNKTEEDYLISPRDIINPFSYQTPTTINIAQELQIQKEVLKSGRREDSINQQFHSNNLNSVNENEGQAQWRENDENIRIYVDQWDGNQSSKKSESISSTDPYNDDGSIEIHTAKNSPLWSNINENERATSDKYSITEKSAEKHLSEVKVGSHAFDYQKPSLRNIWKNLNSTLQENLDNSQTSFDFKGKFSQL